MVDLAHKGKKLPSFSYTIEFQKVREFLIAIGEPDPVLTGEPVVIPPTFAATFPFWGGEGWEATFERIGVQVWNILHAEQEYEYFLPLKVGDTVTSDTHIADIYTKKLSGGELEFVLFETEYTNQDGHRVLIDRSLVIVRG
nr:MaoC family dehydratase N-terminal domain-containing protein [Anaerolineae bacterium]